jgi:hypothetical protein
MHNVWLQQFGKRGAYLYVATLDDYVRVFKQSTLYYHFKQGGRLGQGLDKSELLLRRTTQQGDLKLFVNIILKYSSRSACIVKIADMEVEKIFGSYKQKANPAPRLERDSHRHNCMNIFHPCVNHTLAKSNVEIVQHGVDQIQGNVEVFEAPCGDGVCKHIKRCPPMLHVQCFALQKSTKHSCVTRIIANSTSIGVLTLTYLGLWS